MRLKELLQILRDLDQDRVVVIAHDAEGNGYSTLSVVDGNAALKNGEIGLERLTPNDVRIGCTDEDVMEGGTPAIVLYPL